jgi:hypothetical protein
MDEDACAGDGVVPKTMRRIRFRSYNPRDGELKLCTLLRRAPSHFSRCRKLSWLTCLRLTFLLIWRSADCEGVESPSDVLATVEAEQEAALTAASSKFTSPALDLNNMVPKKSNWELKRALAPKLARLERRTQRSVYELARKATEKQSSDVGDEAGQRLARTVADARLIDSDNENDG